MKKICAVIFMLLITTTIHVTADNIKQKVNICWSVDLCDEVTNEPKGRILKIYNTTSKITNDFSIPSDCYLINSDITNGCIFISPTDNTETINVIYWIDGDTKLIKQYQSPSNVRFLAFMEEFLYYITPDFTDYNENGIVFEGEIFRTKLDEHFNYGCFNNSSSISISQKGNIATDNYNFPSDELGKSIYYLNPKGDAFVINQLDDEFYNFLIDTRIEKNEDFFVNTDESYDQFMAASWMNEDQLLMWGRVNIDSKPFRKMYVEDEFSNVSEIYIPLEYEYHLLIYNLNTRQYANCLNEDGRAIALNDYEVTNQIFIEPINSLAFIKTQNSPLHNLTDHQYVVPNCDELTILSLDSGEFEVLYRVGYSGIDIEDLWELAISEHRRIPMQVNSELKAKLYDYKEIDNGEPTGFKIYFSESFPITYFIE